MGDLQALTESILAKARHEAEEIQQQAALQADEIVAEARQKAEERTAKLREEFERKAETVQRRTQNEVELEARKSLLAAKRDLIDRSFAEAMNSLNNLPAEKRIRFLAERLAAAGKYGGGEVIGAGSSDEWVSIIKVANEIITRSGNQSQLVLSNEQPEFQGGFLLKGTGFTINGSYQAMLDEVKDFLIPEVAGYLFEEKE